MTKSNILKRNKVTHKMIAEWMGISLASFKNSTAKGRVITGVEAILQHMEDKHEGIGSIQDKVKELKIK